MNTKGGYQEISINRARELGKMIASFNDSDSIPVSFNATEFFVICFEHQCSLIIYDNGGCFYKEEKS
jgi:hypothetical protein